MRSESAFRFILVCAACFAAVLLFEIPALFHLVDYRAIIGTNALWWPRNFATDPELLHIRRPNSHIAGAAKGGNLLLEYRIPESGMTAYRWDIQYDRKGFRNRRDGTSAETIVIGDSFVEGMTVSDSQVVTSVMEAVQHKPVMNLGQPGYGPQQELLVLKRYGLPLHPRTVVWMFFEGNDLLDVMHYEETVGKTPGFWQDFLARSFTKNALGRIPWLKPPGRRFSGTLKTVTPVSPVYFSRSMSDSALPEEKLSPALEKTIGVFARAEKICEERGIRLIFVFIPDKFRVLNRFCRYSSDSECRNWRVNDLPARMRAAVRALSPGIGFVDLTPSLESAAAHGTDPYYPDDEHWSPEGHRVAGQVVSAFLQVSGAP